MKQKDMGDVRRVFEETFDVVHGDEGGMMIIVACEAMDFFRVLWI